MEMIYCADDPAPLIDFAAANVPYGRLAQVVVPALRTFRPDIATRYENRLENGIFAKATPGATIAADFEPGYTVLNTFHIDIAYARPNEATANFFLGGRYWLPTWAPNISKQNDYLALVLGNHDDSILDVVPVDAIAKTIHDDTSGKITESEVYLAAEKTISRLYLPPSSDPYRDGVERRPFTLRSDQKSAAMSGLLELRPQFSAGSLHLPLQFTLAAQHPEFFAGIGDDGPDSYPNHAYLINHGQPLIAGVRLRRGNTAIPLTTMVANPDGSFQYDATLEKPDFSNLYLEVDLQYFEQKISLVYDLYASQAAATQRKNAPG